MFTNFLSNCAKRWWIILIILTIAIAFVPSGNQNLTKDSSDDDAVKSVQFEAGYYNFLSGITIPTMGGLLAIIFLSHKDGEWRDTAVRALYAFSIAIFFVVCGYALRTGWMTSGAAFAQWLITLDGRVLAPATAAAYIVGVLLLGWLAYLGLHRSLSAIVNTP